VKVRGAGSTSGAQLSDEAGDQEFLPEKKPGFSEKAGLLQ
jgi:hypothetical protein